MATTKPFSNGDRPTRPPPPVASTKSPPRSPYPNEAYEVGWISALPLELAAARGMLDEEHGNPQAVPPKADSNSYMLGRIHDHNVVLACLPREEVGASSAALVARDILSTFPNIRFGLMVGIGAGIPTTGDGQAQNDIHLGDVVISSDKKTGGVVAYNFGKRLGDGSFEVAYHLNQPPRVLRTALSKLEATHEMRENRIPEYMNQMLQMIPTRMAPKWFHPGQAQDILFPTVYLHQGGKTCLECDLKQKLQRVSSNRSDINPIIHYGIVATGSEVVRHALTRDQIGSKHNAICLEMEAAGLMNDFPCILIRGISDYADSHKNDRWHRYAAASAAACAKELLSFVHPSEVQKAPKASEMIEQIQNIQHRLDEVNTGVKSLNTQSQKGKVTKWLSASDPGTNLSNALESYHKGTCLWFLEGEKFQKWKSQASESLWLRGIPGSGKTVLSSAIIANLREVEADDSSIDHIYFFFDTRDTKKQSLRNLLESLILQLYSKYMHTKYYLEVILLEKYENGNRQPTLLELREMFLKLCRLSEKKIKIILDALDESTTQDDVFNWIKSVKLALDSVGFLITSRDETLLEVEMGIWLHERNYVRLQSDFINSDIFSYIQHSLHIERGFSRWQDRPEIFARIRDAVLQRSSGMYDASFSFVQNLVYMTDPFQTNRFRLAACQLEILKTCIDISEIENELNRLPKTLEGIYNQILYNIRDHHHPTVVRILQFLLHSQRPLKIRELVDAAAVDLTMHPEFDPGRRMPDPQGIFDICPSLLARSSRADHVHNDVIIEIVELGHATVKDYLISLGNSSKFYRIADPNEAQSTIAMVCLAYLSHLDKEHPRELIDNHFPLAKFSARYWFEYAKKTEMAVEVRQAVILFLFDERLRNMWGSIYNPDNPWSDSLTSCKMAAPLYYTCLTGLISTATEILHMGADPSAQGGEYGNALQAASAGGHKEVVNLLLAHGVDPNALGGFLGNALQAAATRGNESVVKLLLQSGANVNAKGGKYGNALQAASARGNYPAAQLLLSYGADPNLQGGKYGNALNVACLRRHKDIVSLLLDNSADCNAGNGKLGTALRAASEADDAEIVHLLLKRGAHIDQPCGLYGSALQAACSRGNQKTVELLLQNHAGPNVLGGLFGSALQAASARGDEELVEMLLSYGSDPNALGGYYNTALQAAATHGHTEVVVKLLGGGAEVNSQEGTTTHSLRTESKCEIAQIEHFLQEEYGKKVHQVFTDDNELMRQLVMAEAHRRKEDDEDEDGAEEDINNPAIESETIYVMKRDLLAARLARDNLRDEFHSNALQAASAYGHKEVVQLLVQAGANPNTAEGIYGSALQAASAQGHEEVARYLLQNRSDPNQKGGFYGTALQAASARGHDHLVQLLLQSGASAGMSGGVFKSALPAAAATGSLLTVELLLKNQPYVDVRNKDYQRALNAASSGGNEPVVRLLLDRGAGVDAHGKWYTKGLHSAVRNGHTGIVKLLLELEADVNVQIRGFGSVLQTACRRGNVEIANLLLLAGAKVNALGGIDGSALRAAAKGGHETLIRLLLDHGAEVNAGSECYCSALEAAVGQANLNVVKLLLDNGAALDGNKILTSAARGGHIENIRLLLEAGADIEALGWWRRGTALHAASEQGHERVVEILLEASANVNHEFDDALYAASDKGHHRIVEILLDAGADVSKYDHYMSSALGLAVYRGHETIVRILLHHGCNSINSRSSRGSYPLYQASKSGHVGIVDLLIRYGADVNQRSKYKDTAIERAALEGHEAVMKILLKAGAELSTRVAQNAAQKGHCHILELLLEEGADVSATQQLLSAGRSGDENKLRSILQKGVDFELRAALEGIAESGHLGMMELVLDWGMARRILISCGEAICKATYHEQEQMVKLLLEKSVEPHIEISISLALSRALEHGCSERVLMLFVNAGAVMAQYDILSLMERGFSNVVRNWMSRNTSRDPNAPVIDYNYLFSVADEEMMKVLIEGSDASSNNLDLEKALVRAISIGSDKIIRLLIGRGADVTKVASRIQDSLTKMIKKGHKGIARLLIEEGACQKSDEKQKADQLHAAAAGGLEDIGRLMLKHGANIHVQGHRYGNALQAAAGGGQTNIVELLLSQGADVNAINGKCCSALEEACNHGNPQTVKRLIEAGADVNNQSGFFQLNPLEVASRRGHKQAVEVLLRAGADTNTSSGALLAAVINGRAQITALLLENGANIASADVDLLQLASVKGYYRMAKVLLDHGAHMETDIGPFGSALQGAAAEGHDRIARLLLDRGANVNATGGRHGSALHAAIKNGHKGTVKLLIGRGADANQLIQPHGSPLQVALWLKSDGRDMVELLLKLGAAVDSPCGDLGTALQMACATLSYDGKIVQLLLEYGADVHAQCGTYGNALQAASFGSLSLHNDDFRMPSKSAGSLGLEELEKVKVYEETKSDEGTELDARTESDPGWNYDVPDHYEKGDYKASHYETGNYQTCDFESGFYETGSYVAGYAEHGYDEISREIHDHESDILVGTASLSPQESCSRRPEDAYPDVFDKQAEEMESMEKYYNDIAKDVERGHGEDDSISGRIVRILLNKGVQVNLQGGLYGNALQAAASSGHTEVVKMLLDAGADIDMQGGEFGNALSAAASNGHGSTVSLLLRRGINVNAHGASCGTALQVALSKGDATIAIMLLKAGADANMQKGDAPLPFRIAAENGNWAIIKILMADGIPFECQEVLLSRAAFDGQIGMVTELLDRGIDVNIQNINGTDAFQAASSQGHLDVVELLLSRGYDVDKRDKSHGNALQATSAGGCDGAAMPLSYEEAAINGASGFHETLQADFDAAVGINYSQVGRVGSQSYENILKVFNEASKAEGMARPRSSGGSEAATTRSVRAIDEPTSQGQHPEGAHGFQKIPLRERRHIVANMLLKEGADVNASGGDYGTPLQAAAHQGSAKMVGKLLAMGADVDALGGRYGTALQAAICGGHYPVARILLDAGANVKAQGGEFGNALQAAANAYMPDLVEELLRRGAPVNAQGGHFGNALQAAAYQGAVEIVDILLRHGAQVNAAGGRNGSALQAALHP